MAAEQSSSVGQGESRIKRLEEQHEREMLEKMEERQAVVKDLRKEATPECRFWKLQQKKGSSPKAAQKIKEFCSAKS